MSLTRAKANVARTAHLTAWARALGRLTAGDVANGDYLAERVLRPHQAALIRVPRVCRWLFERGLPGALGYSTLAHGTLDDVLLEEARVGLEQLVILGAGFDSRSIRFSDALRTARVFEVDMPEVLALRAERLLRATRRRHQPSRFQSTSNTTISARHCADTVTRPVRGRYSCGKVSPTTCPSRRYEPSCRSSRPKANLAAASCSTM